MKSLNINLAQWSLILAAVLLLAVTKRLDLLAIVAPVAVVVSYVITVANRETNSSQRRI